MENQQHFQYKSDVFLGEPDESELPPKYRVINVSHLIPISVEYQDFSGKHTIQASIDYATKTVYLPNDVNFFYEGELKSAILDFLASRSRPPEIPTPDPRAVEAAMQAKRLVQEKLNQQREARND